MVEITITRALAEIKLIEKRINNKINSTHFIGEKKKSANKINNISTVEEFTTEVQASYQSIIDLIERKKIIKSAIVKSNAETIVKIGEVEMTRADSIERKSAINLDKLLLNSMIQQYNSIVSDVNRKNEMMEANLDKQVQTMVGSDGKKTEGITAFSEQYRNTNGFDVIDPIQLKNKIEKLQTEIEDFETNVDFVLSESNSISKIEIPD